MTILTYAFTRMASNTLVTVTTSLTSPTIFWYRDGVYVGSTSALERWFFVSAGEQAEIVAIDSTNPAFDPIANQPVAFPAARTLWWTRSTDADVADYVVAQEREAEGPVTIATVPQRAGAWTFAVVTPRLDDLTNYTWTITPRDAAGNLGTPITIGPELIVRRPDSPDFTVAFNAGPDTVTFTAA